MEIRTKVVEYVQQRIEKLVKEQPAKYSNAGVALINAMKYLPNFFKKGQVIQTQYSIETYFIVTKDIFLVSRPSL